MEEALKEAAQALAAGDFPVGCVLVHNHQVVARGRRLRSGAAPEQPVNEVDHAEVLALRHLLDQRPEVPLAEVTVYSTMEPCLMCYATLLVSGIRAFVFAYEDAMGGGTSLRLDQLPPFYQAMTVEIVPHILRTESLRLFKQFFTASANPYLTDTLLADYTRAQP